ncbi:succinoglycan biosynthesis protein [Dictyobacter aurantiacus]|uniref:Succinoglycan biosynthesis protein n=2 Tax=Dictyobacter aurantiacus TaxID=1936993 RepID=A0A401ZKK3_9CHLR|nr:succinoglycan biosynthesis protein [Dictyobacter aurantiacus]
MNVNCSTGRLMHGGLAVLLLCLLCMTMLTPAQAAPSSSHDTGDEVTSWLRQHAVPFTTAEPGSSDADLRPLAQMIGSAQVLGLGEETHGTHEFFAMKARIIEYMVQHMGVTAFAMEDDWGMSQGVDNYINGGSQDIWSVMLNDLFITWRTQEVKSLLEWLRTYNADPAHPHKVHFYGIDIQSLERPTVDGVLNYLRKVDPSQVETAHTIYQKFIGDNQNVGGWSQYKNLDQAGKQRYVSAAKQIYDVLHTHQAAYIQHSSPQAFAEALQDARVVVQYATVVPDRIQQDYALFSADHLPQATDPSSYYWFLQRDVYMAENVNWLQQHNVGRMVLWAHDDHIARNAALYHINGVTIEGNMGFYLQRWLGARYLPLGMTFSSGSFNANFSFSPTSYTIDTPNPYSLNGTLASVNLPRYMLDLRQAPRQGAVADWLDAGQAFRTVGMYPGTGKDEIYTPRQAFDIIIHFQRSHPSRMLSSQASFFGTLYDNANYIILGIIAFIALIIILVALLRWHYRRRLARERAFIQKLRSSPPATQTTTSS